MRDQRIGVPEHLRGTWVHPQHPGPWQAQRLTRGGLVVLRQYREGAWGFTTATPEQLTTRWEAQR